MDENPLSERYRGISYPSSAFNWMDTDSNQLPPTRRLSFIAESKAAAGERWFPTVSGTDVNIEIVANNPKAHRHSRISEHGGYTPVILEANSPKWQEQADSHQEYRQLTGQPFDLDNAPHIQTLFKNRMEDLYKERPNFPRSFNTLSRAQFVSELVAGRIMTGQPLGRKK